MRLSSESFSQLLVHSLFPALSYKDLNRKSQAISLFSKFTVSLGNDPAINLPHTSTRLTDVILPYLTTSAFIESFIIKPAFGLLQPWPRALLSQVSLLLYDWLD